MTKMTKAQAVAIREAHAYRVDCANGVRDGHVFRSSGRKAMVSRMIEAEHLDAAGRVVWAGLIEAGVDMDAIHAEALIEDAGYVRWYPAEINETTDAHPGDPDGPWLRFADCAECGAGRGYPCVNMEAHVLPGRLLGHAHPSRALDAPTEPRTDVDPHGLLEAAGIVKPLTPAEDRTGVSDVTHALADEIAGLHDELNVSARTVDVTACLVRLDRIAALVPQRATDEEDWPLYLSPCGDVRGWYGPEPTDGLLYCEIDNTAHPMAEWRALYTVAGR